MLKELAKGKRSVVYLCKFNGKLAVKKVEKENIQAVNRINNEVFWLKKINKFKIGPKLYSSKKTYFICEYIKGKNIIPYLESVKNPGKVILKVLKQCRILDKLKADKKEMTNPYKHIIVRNNKPVMIDFERTRFSAKPQNVTAFFQFLTSKKIQQTLKKKLELNNQKLMPLLKEYKKTYSEKDFNELVKELN
ncbi:hypothetical protein HYX16_05970 [Candidatus Woesearchaeota archaeon]|nr:hypothetical protein [Candidatus Woesearchaeota archaeon]